MLDFSSSKKSSLPVKLPDGKIYKVFSPTKQIFDALGLLEKQLSHGTGMQDKDAIHDIYSLIAQVMSRNDKGVKITSDYLEELLDFEDLQVFFNAYVSFVVGETRDPN